MGDNIWRVMSSQGRDVGFAFYLCIYFKVLFTYLLLGLGFVAADFSLVMASGSYSRRGVRASHFSVGGLRCLFPSLLSAERRL